MNILNFKKPRFESDEEAISALTKIANALKIHEKPDMDKVLATVEAYVDGEIKDARLAFWLGTAWCIFTAL